MGAGRIRRIALKPNVFLMALAGGAPWAAPAASQVAAGAPEAERIIVTETLRPRAETDLAGNIARLDESDIIELRPEHISEALNRLPGVYIHRGSGQEHLTAIRSPVLTGGAGAGSFLYLENGVPLRAAGFANVNGLFEAHGELAGAIEALRGPGGVLYGSNAVHGMINVIPRKAEETGFGADVSGGSYGRVIGNAWGAIRQGGQGFFAGFTEIKEGGYRDDASVDQQKLTLRHDAEGAGWRATTLLAGHNLNQETAGFVIGSDAFRDPALRRKNPNPEAFRDARAARLSSRIEIDLADDRMLAVTPYARWNDMDFLMHFLPSRALEQNGHWSLGAKTAYYIGGGAGAPGADGGVGGQEIILGLDAEYTNGFLTEFQSIPTVFSFTQGLHYDYEIDQIALAPYAHWERQIAPRLRLAAGIRLDWTRYDYDNRTEDGLVGRFLRVADRSDSYLAPTAKLGAVYDLSDTLQSYVRYSRGSRPPQTTDLYRLQINQTVGDIDAEAIDAVEGGLRGGAGAFDFELAGYFMDKRNFFFRDADGFNVSDGRTRHVGAELRAGGDLHETFRIETSLTYGRHTYRFDNQVARSTEVISFGDTVDTAPRWLGNGRAVWTPLDALRAELEWVWVDNYFTDAANTNSYEGHNVFNLRASWQATPNAEFFGAIRNLTNKLYAERADFAFGNPRFFPGEERAFTAGARVRF